MNKGGGSVGKKKYHGSIEQMKQISTSPSMPNHTPIISKLNTATGASKGIMEPLSKESTTFNNYRKLAP
jgi:hypothetical protein